MTFLSLPLTADVDVLFIQQDAAACLTLLLLLLLETDRRNNHIPLSGGLAAAGATPAKADCGPEGGNCPATYLPHPFSVNSCFSLDCHVAFVL